MVDKPDGNRGSDLPVCASEFIRRVVRRMWWRRKARQEVQAELTAHFEDALRDCATAEEKERAARELIEGFGDARLLATLCHRAKKRCRPLWLKALVRSGQGLGVILLYGIVCMLPTLVGRPTIRVNYAQWLSNHWRPQGQGGENAKVYYDKAVELYVPPPQGLEEKMQLRRWGSVGYSDSDVQVIEQWLAGNQAMFSALRQGANTPHYWPTYDSNESTPIETSIVGREMQSLGQWRRVMFAFKQQILWEARRGEVAQALDDCLALGRFGRHVQNKGSLSGQLAGISMESLSYDGIMALAQNPELAPAILERVQKELTARFDLNRQVIDLECEKALWLDHIQRTFTDDGRGGGHALSEGFPYAAGDWTGNLLRTLRFHYPDRRQTVAMVERFFHSEQMRLNALPEARHIADPNAPAQISTLNLMLSLVAPAYERVAQQAWRLKTHEVGVITLLALRRYFRANGSYPENLDLLVQQGFLKPQPRDPFGRGTLTYRKTDQGFLLYSWGLNFQDDGGQSGTDSQGRPRNWADNGDWVLGPIDKP